MVRHLDAHRAHGVSSIGEPVASASASDTILATLKKHMDTALQYAATLAQTATPVQLARFVVHEQREFDNEERLTQPPADTPGSDAPYQAFRILGASQRLDDLKHTLAALTSSRDNASAVAEAVCAAKDAVHDTLRFLLRLASFDRWSSLWERMGGNVLLRGLMVFFTQCTRYASTIRDGVLRVVIWSVDRLIDVLAGIATRLFSLFDGAATFVHACMAYSIEQQRAELLAPAPARATSPSIWSRLGRLSHQLLTYFAALIQYLPSGVMRFRKDMNAVQRESMLLVFREMQTLIVAVLKDDALPAFFKYFASLSWPTTLLNDLGVSVGAILTEQSLVEFLSLLLDFMSYLSASLIAATAGQGSASAVAITGGLLVGAGAMGYFFYAIVIRKAIEHLRLVGTRFTRQLDTFKARANIERPGYVALLGQLNTLLENAGSLVAWYTRLERRDDARALESLIGRAAQLFPQLGRDHRDGVATSAGSVVAAIAKDAGPRLWRLAFYYSHIQSTADADEQRTWLDRMYEDERVNLLFEHLTGQSIREYGPATAHFMDTLQHTVLIGHMEMALSVATRRVQAQVGVAGPMPSSSPPGLQLEAWIRRFKQGSGLLVGNEHDDDDEDDDDDDDDQLTPAERARRRNNRNRARIENLKVVNIREITDLSTAIVLAKQQFQNTSATLQTEAGLSRTNTMQALQGLITRLQHLELKRKVVQDIDASDLNTVRLNARSSINTRNLEGYRYALFGIAGALLVGVSIYYLFNFPQELAHDHFVMALTAEPTIAPATKSMLRYLNPRPNQEPVTFGNYTLKMSTLPIDNESEWKTTLINNQQAADAFFKDIHTHAQRKAWTVEEAQAIMQTLFTNVHQGMYGFFDIMEPSDVEYTSIAVSTAVGVLGAGIAVSATVATGGLAPVAVGGVMALAGFGKASVDYSNLPVELITITEEDWNKLLADQQNTVLNQDEANGTLATFIGATVLKHLRGSASLSKIQEYMSLLFAVDPKIVRDRLAQQGARGPGSLFSGLASFATSQASTLIDFTLAPAVIRDLDHSMTTIFHRITSILWNQAMKATGSVMLYLLVDWMLLGMIEYDSTTASTNKRGFTLLGRIVISFFRTVLILLALPLVFSLNTTAKIIIGMLTLIGTTPILSAVSAGLRMGTQMSLAASTGGLAVLPAALQTLQILPAAGMNTDTRRILEDSITAMRIQSNGDLEQQLEVYESMARSFAKR